MLTTLDLSKLAEQLLTELTAQLPERIFEIQVQHFEYPCGVLHADKIYMEILLTNLISNAIKFTQGKSPDRIEFGYSMDGGVCIYYLKDNGIGFDMKDVDSVFSPFKRLHSEKEFGGYGIGLAVVQAIIRLHNGRFWVESEPGEGATFFFTLEDWQG